MQEPTSSIRLIDYLEIEIVYAWKRLNNFNYDYLYIGRSDKGFSRIFTNHHVINVREKIQDTDLIDVWHTNNSRILEAELIILHKPKYNIQLGSISFGLCNNCGSKYIRANQSVIYCNDCLRIKSKNEINSNTKIRRCDKCNFRYYIVDVKKKYCNLCYSGIYKVKDIKLFDNRLKKPKSCILPGDN